LCLDGRVLLGGFGSGSIHFCLGLLLLGCLCGIGRGAFGRSTAAPSSFAAPAARGALATAGGFCRQSCCRGSAGRSCPKSHGRSHGRRCWGHGCRRCFSGSGGRDGCGGRLGGRGRG
jgi:hypothetical protein